MLDASQNKAEILTDLPKYASIAKNLFKQGSYVGIIGNAELIKNDLDI
jgi:hypothetical protein